MERNKLIAFALNFASFLLEKMNVNAIILFGSVAKNQFDDESDIDLFIETENKNKDKINSILELYEKSKDYETFKLLGIKNDISIKCGKLVEWTELKMSIISGGIVLYGTYQSTPEKLNHKVLFLLSLENNSKAKKVKIWRKIYGYRQRVGKKTYISKGMIEKRLGRGAFIVPIEDSQKVIDYLKSNKIKYLLSD